MTSIEVIAQSRARKQDKEVEAKSSSSSRNMTSKSKAKATHLLLLIVIINPLLLFVLLLVQLNIAGCGHIKLVQAVSVQRLNVPDLVVIDQQQSAFRTQQQQQQPEAASLINQSQLASDLVHTQSLAHNNTQNEPHHQQQQQQQLLNTVTFECLISYDKRKDKNLIVKWHHDDRVEPIYQWIPELNKPLIAPHYRSYISPITAQSQLNNNQQQQTGPTNSTSSNIQLLEAGFKLVRPSKELAGKYTCSAISTQNDDSKWKKMIVYAPPRFFRFNATRTDIGAQLADQRDRLIQLTQPASISMSMSQQQSLPLAYRMRPNDNNNNPLPTTISPQMYSTIDYVNVNQQRIRPQMVAPSLLTSTTSSSSAWQTSQASSTSAAAHHTIIKNKHNGVKLVCDIDQVFPVPEVSIYRLAKLDGSHPDKLAKFDTRIDRYAQSGLYHVQVISVLEDDEMQIKYGLNEPVYFECSIALTNLELSKYADNKRSLIYKPGLLTNSEQELNGNNLASTLSAQNSANNSNNPTTTTKLIILMSGFLLAFLPVLLNWPDISS